MEFASISSISGLSFSQKASLAKGSVDNVSDLLLTSLNDVAKSCKISVHEVKSIVDIACKQLWKEPRPLEDVLHEGKVKVTTGDASLDKALGGGIRTGMIWEIAGESAAGKTQLALQLSLLVQLPPRLGGISGSTCYLTTSSVLPTSRLVQMMDVHPLLAPSLCNLADIHTISVPTIPILLHVLSKILPEFIKERSDAKPVKLLVLDTLAELFHTSDKTTTQTLVARSRDLSEISLLLHTLATEHQIAVLVLNEVSDVFDYGSGRDMSARADLSYREQSRWFNRANSIPGEDRKEASLGLVWANQVNARIFLSRTGRRRYLEDNLPDKRLRTAQSSLVAPPSDSRLNEDQPTLIRRLSVVFSSVSPPTSLDYIVTAAGISILPDSEPPNNSSSVSRVRRETGQTNSTSPQVLTVGNISPLDVGCIEDDNNSSTPHNEIVDKSVEGDLEDDEWEAYWKENDLSQELYRSLELDSEGNVIKS